MLATEDITGGWALMAIVQCNLRIDEGHKELVNRVGKLLRSEPEFAERLAAWLNTNSC